MAGRSDDLEETRRARKVAPRRTDVDTVPLDREPALRLPLPHIIVNEPSEDAPTGQEHSSSGPDLIVLRVLGEGGMGRVQLARQRSLQREVAIKRPRSDGTDREAMALRAEALITGHLEHPNIIPVHALGVDGAGQPVIVMKRVEGVSWRDLLNDDQHPGWATREPDPGARLVWHLGILAQLCNAIAFAHSRGIVHRDMKPDNVMVGEFGEVYLIDWGVAIETGTRSRDPVGRPIVVGTPAYMAPEMARGDAIDEQTDVYLLGATLHEVLTGRPRHTGDNIQAVTAQAIASAPHDYGHRVPDELARLANLATSTDPTSRPPGALAFRQALLDHLHHRGSLRLSAQADRRMAAIESDPAAAQGRAIEECRFGYREALREWPDNQDALRGIERCALATVRLELGRCDPGAARAALAELPDPPRQLWDAVGRLESAIAADDAERDRLRRLAHDADPTVDAPTRMLMFSILLVLAASLSVYAVRVHRTGGVGAAELIAFPGLTATASLVFVLLFRRQLAVNAFNRRMAAWFMALAVLLLASRVVGQSTGSSLPHQFASDSLLLAAMFTTGGLFLFRWLWICAAGMVASAAVAALAPAAAHIAFELAAASSAVIAAVLIPKRPRLRR